MIQEDLPVWPDPTTLTDDYTVPYETLVKLGRGDPMAGRRLLRMMIDIEVVHEPINGPTARPENVRTATIDDEVSLVNLLLLDIRENAQHIAPPDVGELYVFVQAATRDLHNRGAAKPIIGVIGAPDRVQGAIFLELEKWFWSKQWFLQERLTVVHPECRKSRHAADLVKFARWFTDTMSEQAGFQVQLLGSVVATVNSGPKQAFFGRLMNRVGSVYCYPDPTRS